jgi:hypothetical protein
MGSVVVPYVPVQMVQITAPKQQELLSGKNIE